LPAMVPGLTMQPTGASRPIFLRGVGNNNNSNVGSAVLVFIDGVYYPYQAGNLPYNNVASVEVDKGPQGTLFGRNATGGVIQITTRDPKFTPAADAEVGYANFQTVNGSLYATGGLGERLAGDLAVYYLSQKDGWGHNLFTGQDVFTNKNVAARSKWLLRATDDTQVRFAFDYLTSEGTDGTDVLGAVNYPVLFNEVTRETFTIPGEYNVNSNYQPGFTVRQLGASMRIDTQLGDLRGVSITSWHNQRTTLYIDYDGTPIPFFNLYRFDHRDAETQEFQLLSADNSAVKWVAGLYFYNDTGTMHPFRFGGIGGSVVFGAPAGDPFDIVANDRVTSYAGFGQATATILPDTNLTLGVRYTMDQRYINGYTLQGPDVVPESRGALSKTFKKPTYRVLLDHHFGRDLMVYASYNRGFNSGYFNQTSVGGFSAAADPAVNPEIIDAYEIGTKSEWLEHRLRLNASGFWYQYKNLQQQVYEGAALVTINAAAARIRGVDLDIESKPLPQLTLAASAEYLNAKFIRYPGAPIYSMAPNGALISTAGDAAGNRIPYAPEWSYNVRASYDLQSVVGDFNTTAAVAYTGAWFGDPGNFYQQPSRTLVNASQTWTSTDGKNYLSVWGKNLTNKKYDVGINMLAPVGAIGNPGPPRTYGVTVGHHF
jgi:iron complex outermembrane recepter protein